MWTQSLGKDTMIDFDAALSAAAQTTVTGTTIDMQDWDGIIAIALLSSAVNGAVVQLEMQEGAVSTGSDAALPTGGANAQYTFGATPLTGLLLSEVYRPQSRYVTPVLTLRHAKRRVQRHHHDPLSRACQPVHATGNRFGPGPGRGCVVGQC